MSIGGHSVPRLPLEAYHRRRQRCQSTSDIKAASPKPSTMESVRIAFHAQLATVMDSLLAAAVCEIAKIFESSLCEQQVALAQKTDEISVLRSQLEKQERRPKAKCGGSEEGEKLLGDRESSRNHQSLTGSGLNVEDDASTQSDPMDRLSGGLKEEVGGLKEEVIGQDGASVKHEPAVSQPARESIGAQASEGSISAADERQTDSSAVTQAKAKLSQWDQGSHTADHRPLQDQGSTPFISISQSGRCSPRADPSLSRPAEWLPSQYPPSQGGVSSLENLQADGTSCSGTDTSSFRPGFVSDETSNEDDNDSFPFLDQEPENQHNNQKSVQGQGVVQRVVRQVQAQAGEATWRLGDNSGGGGSISHPRRVTTFGNRDPLQPQSNSLSLMPRQSNSFSHAGTPGGGNGRPYTCPYCTKCFTYPSHQRRHLLRHTGVRLHPCQFCEKSFLTPSELTVHTRTHTGERPFGCAQCGKRFARSGNLRAHQRDVHLGKRPFACTECGKRFAHRGNLRVHNHRVHQGDPYYMEDQQQPEIVLNPI